MSSSQLCSEERSCKTRRKVGTSLYIPPNRRNRGGDERKSKRTKLTKQAVSDWKGLEERPYKSSYKSRYTNPDFDELIGEVICEGICEPIARGFIFLVEDEICKFVANSKSGEVLLFPHMTSYYRLILHKTAERFSVKSKSVGMDEQRRIQLVLKDNSLIPLVKYRDLIPEVPNSEGLLKASAAFYSDFSPRTERKNDIENDLSNMKSNESILFVDVPRVNNSKKNKIADKNETDKLMSDDELENRGVDLAARKLTYYDWDYVVELLHSFPRRADRDRKKDIDLRDVTSKHIFGVGIEPQKSSKSLQGVLQEKIQTYDKAVWHSVSDTSVVVVFSSIKSAQRVKDQIKRIENLTLNSIEEIPPDLRAVIGFPLPEKRPKRDTSVAKRLIGSALGVS